MPSNKPKLKHVELQNKTNMYEGSNNNDSFLFSPPGNRIYNSPSTNVHISNQIESEEKNIFFSNSNGLWKEWYNPESRDLFNQTLVCPAEFLFFDPTTVIIQSKVKSSQNISLPKIYSVDSVNENMKKSENISNIDNKSLSDEANILGNYHSGKGQSNETIVSSQTTTVEDLFRENVDLNASESQSTTLQQKISSLFNVLMTSEIDNEDNIFYENPPKVKNSETTHLLEQDGMMKVRFNVNKAINSTNKLTNKQPENRAKQKNENLQSKNVQVNRVNINNKQNCQDPNIHYNSEITHPLNLLQCDQNDVIYDKRSLIEIFRATELNKTSNSGSYPKEESMFCMWPVEAEYIHVSGGRRYEGSCSVSSDNSTSLTQGFEKSFYALHLNKRYEQNQLYEGDLIVLENTKGHRNRASSSYTMLNKSYVVFDVNHHEVNRSINNEEKFNSDKYIRTPTFKNTQPISFEKGILSQTQNNFEMQNTMAVQYAQCENPFLVRKPNIQTENYDYLNIKQFDKNSWNSFISIYTSKVGPSAQINHHRMFGKIINNIGMESLTDKNLFNNVHTLTSNGGPFRLFDINGYPLTDSTGNVLKDPYGKSIVYLDSTGFPKNDIKVFDAAGNSPEDINFDPTQKPKTNSIIIKLTDNFKRPLHLYDKYGRPLTDAYGKLLVNIHGRPLLRFDNFGRPNTDYRGGPLYTDEGFRWSYKSGESLSTDQISKETLSPTKSSYNQHKLGGNCSAAVNKENKYPYIDKKNCENCDAFNIHKDTIPILNNKKSDIWIKVENVFQHLPNRKKLDQNISQTKMIINNVSLPKDYVVKESLSPIIYHDNILHHNVAKKDYINPNNDVKFKELMNVKPKQNNIIGDFKITISDEVNDTVKRLHLENEYKNNINVNSINNNAALINFNQLENREIGNCTPLLEDKIKYMKNGVYLENTPNGTVHYPFYNNILIKNTCSKCFPQKQMSHQQLRTLISNKKSQCRYDCYRNSTVIENDQSSTYGLIRTSSCNPTQRIKNTKSHFTFKNHDYINNLCNEILKNQFEKREKLNSTIQTMAINKTKHWTNRSFTKLTSSDESKYTSEFSTTTKTPNLSMEGCRTFSQKTFKINNDSYNNTLKTQTKQKQVYTQDQRFINNEKTYCEDYKNEDLQSRLGKKEVIFKNQINTSNHTKRLWPSSEEPILSVNILNQEDKHYEIKVSERIKNYSKENLDNISCSQENSSLTNTNFRKSNQNSVTPQLEREFIPKHHAKNHASVLYDNNNLQSKHYQEKNDSPFRFPSDTHMKSTIALNSCIEVQHNQWGNRNLDYTTSSNKGLTYNETDKEHIINQKNKNKYFKDKYNYHNEMSYCNKSEKSGPKGCELHQEQPKPKRIHESRHKSLEGKDISAIKKQALASKECNFVSFLGSPVKYVLNKIDNKLLSRPHIGNKIEHTTKSRKQNILNENTSHINHGTNQHIKNKKVHDMKTETVSEISKSNKKETVPYQKFQKYSNFNLKHKRDLLALQSKSCTELVNHNNILTMSYSGNKTNPVESFKDMPSNNTELRKCTSTTSYISHHTFGVGTSLPQGRKYEFKKPKLRNEVYSLFKPNVPKKKPLIFQHHNAEKKIKQIKKKSPDGHPKTTMNVLKNKTKEITLFKKVDNKSKPKRIK